MSFHERATGVWPLTGESLSAQVDSLLFPLMTHFVPADNRL